MKRGKQLIKISKEVALELNKNHGVHYGENGISHTVGKGKKRTYYLCESTVNMQKLNKINNK